MPSVAIVVASSYAFAAWEARQRDENWGGFLVAAGLVVSIVPFTLLFMGTTNNTLISSANGALTLSASETSNLIQRWELLNSVRSLLPLLAAATGFFTFVGNLK